MIYAFLFFQLVALVSLITIGYHRPETLRTKSFIFTRRCLGIAMLSSGFVTVFLHFQPDLEDTAYFLLIAWILVIVTFRGIFEILSGR